MITIKEYRKGQWTDIVNNFSNANEALQDALEKCDNDKSNALYEQLYKENADGDVVYHPVSEEDAAFYYSECYGGERKIIL